MQAKADNPRLVFLSVPESLRGQVESSFSIDPDIPLPVEIPDGDETLNLEALSWEMIVSGMLRVVSDGRGGTDVKPEWIDYYRRFVVTVRPEILSEFTDAAIFKARGGDFELALEILDSLAGLFPFSPAVALNRALVMEEKASALEKRNGPRAAEAFDLAQVAYAQALSVGGGFPAAHFNAGFFYLGRKDFRRAKECFLAFLEIADEADGREKIGQAKAVIRDIDKSGLEDESFHKAHTLVGQGNEEEGMRHIRDFIERYPDVWNGWFVLGWALRRQSRWQDAALAFGKAVELGGGGSDTRNELAICQMELGDLPAARRELEAALRDDPENIKIISNLGVLALKSGDSAKAAAFFRTVLELDPEDPIAKKFSC